MRRDPLGQAVVLLQIDRQIGRRLPANFGQRLGVLLAIDGDPHDVGPGVVEHVHLADGRVDVLRVRGRHALHGDRAAAADGDRADADGAGWIAGDLHDLGSFEPNLGRTASFCVTAAKLGNVTHDLAASQFRGRFDRPQKVGFQWHVGLMTIASPINWSLPVPVAPLENVPESAYELGELERDFPVWRVELWFNLLSITVLSVVFAAMVLSRIPNLLAPQTLGEFACLAIGVLFSMGGIVGCGIVVA